MRAASLSSPRLRRVLRLLRDGRPHSTRDICLEAGVMAVSACVSELRQNGADIHCGVKVEDGRRIYYYTMLKGPKDA